MAPLSLSACGAAGSLTLKEAPAKGRKEGAPTGPLSRWLERLGRQPELALVLLSTTRPFSEGRLSSEDLLFRLALRAIASCKHGSLVVC